MKLHYSQDTDSRYIDLSSKVSANSEEISDGRSSPRLPDAVRGGRNAKPSCR